MPLLEKWHPSIDWEKLRQELGEPLERFGLDRGLFRAAYEPSEDEIQKRAYEIYLARHGGPGNERTTGSRPKWTLRKRAK